MSEAVMWMPLDNEHSATMGDDANIYSDDEDEDEGDNARHSIVLPSEEVRESLNYADEVEDMEDDVLDYCDYYAPLQCSCKTFWNSRYGRVVIYMFLVLLLVASLTSFVVVVQLIVVPYNRASFFRVANCSVLGVSHVELMDSHCACGRGSQGCGGGGYTCLQVHVQYATAAAEGEVTQQGQGHGHGHGVTLHNASIAENEIMLGKNCSFFPTCKASHAENLQQLEDYQDIYGRYNEIYPCLYNPINHKQVIRAQHFQIHHVIHGLVWSLAFLLVTIATLVYVLLRMKYIYYYK